MIIIIAVLLIQILAYIPFQNTCIMKLCYRQCIEKTFAFPVKKKSGISANMITINPDPSAKQKKHLPANCWKMFKYC